MARRPQGLTQGFASAVTPVRPHGPDRVEGTRPPPRRFDYTVHDTPAVVRRIEQDLATVLEAVRAADPSLRALVLTGGFARGEGTVLRDVPQNDYDFVAIRGTARPTGVYAPLSDRLSAQLGLHIDLAAIASWRLPHVARSVFWYETALRGRVLWRRDEETPLLRRIPVRTPEDLDPAEGLRLLVNRSAGLLLVTGDPDPHARRIQAAKALLAALDAQLLAAGRFAPSQRERWAELHALRDAGLEPNGLHPFRGWLEWAFAFKLDPGRAPERDADQAWRAARKAILRALPAALRHAGLRDLDAYGREDGWLDRAVFLRRSASLPGARRFARHPTARLRVATLRLLADSPDGQVRAEAAAEHLRALARGADAAPLQTLDLLRKATLQ